jgi:hypothetical protein
VQLDNEPDLQGFTPRNYANYANHLHNLVQKYGLSPFISLAGLGTGLGNSSSYLREVLPLLRFRPDLVAIHCYDGDTNQSAEEIIDLWNASYIPVIVTEWNKANQDIWSMLQMLNGAEGLSTAWNSWYPYTTAMNDTTQGLVDTNGKPTPYGASFVSCPWV